MIITVLKVAMIDKIAHWFSINPIDYASLKAMYIGGYSRQSSSYSPPSTSTNLENDYKVLKIKETASDAEVKKAYRKLAQEYHPDKVNHLGEDMRKAAEDKFTILNQAYERIKKARGFLLIFSFLGRAPSLRSGSVFACKSAVASRGDAKRQRAYKLAFLPPRPQRLPPLRAFRLRPHASQLAHTEIFERRVGVQNGNIILKMQILL